MLRGPSERGPSIGHAQARAVAAQVCDPLTGQLDEQLARRRADLAAPAHIRTPQPPKIVSLAPDGTLTRSVRLRSSASGASRMYMTVVDLVRPMVALPAGQ